MKPTQSFFRILSYVLGMTLLMSSCFFRTTEKTVQRYYANKSVKPRVQIIENDSLRIRVASTGADTLPMLLLIHGAPGAWWGYQNLIDDEELQKKYHIVSVDRIGYGRSRLKNLKHVTSIEEQANCLLQVLAINKSKEKVRILGRSYGAPIAAAMTVKEPDKFKALWMISPVIDPNLEKFYWFSGLVRPHLLRQLLPRELRVAVAEKEDHSEQLRQITYIWDKITIPTTVITGGKDWIADPQNLAFAQKYILASGVQFISLPLAGHMITFSHKNLIKSMLISSSNYRRKTSTIDLGKHLSYQKTVELE